MTNRERAENVIREATFAGHSFDHDPLREAIEKALDAVRDEAIKDLCCRIEAAKVSAKAKRKRGKLDGLDIRWALSDLAQQLRSLRSVGGET